MIQSMTGFATQQFTLSLDPQTPITATLSIKSLNSRFFEATFKLPPAFSALETDLITACKKELRRGHVFFSLTVSPATSLKTEVDVAMPIVASYMRAIEKVQKKFSLPGQLTVSDFVQLPNVFSVEEKMADEHARAEILKATGQVLKLLVETRTKEGAMIEQDSMQRIAKLEQYRAELEKRASSLMEQRKTDIGGKITQLGYSSDQLLETHRAALYNELSKTDVTEELVRFQNHLQNLSAIFTSTDVEKGKRLDFTLQELVREVNTIASKSADARIGALVIDGKVELEKIREQAQNVV